MKFQVPDKHLTISNILMVLTLFAVAGGAIGVVLQQVLMLVITVAVLGAFSLAIYAIWQVVQRGGGVFVRYEEPTYYDGPHQVEHVHYHYHKMIAEQPQTEQRMIEQQPTRYTVLPQPQQRVSLPQPPQRARLEVRR